MKVSIIGAGPRGIATLTRIVPWYEREHEENKAIAELEVRLFDQFPIGGHIWRIDQPTELMMNTPTAHTTLYTDETVQMHGPLRTGPTLYEWLRDFAPDFISEQGEPDAADLIAVARRLGPNDYAPRRLYGVYQRFVFKQLQQHLPAGVKLTFVQDLVQDLVPLNPGFRVVTSEGSFEADNVIVASGHFTNQATIDQQELIDFAAKSNVTYLPPMFPGDADLSVIQPQENVFVRGLGLSFYDYMAELTIGRGGWFEPVGNKLHYHVSGSEPHIIAGSRRGFPYYPKPNNEKGYGEKIRPSFVTKESLTQLGETGELTGNVLFGLMKREIELVYYSLLLRQKDREAEIADFRTQYQATTDPAVLIDRLFNRAEQLDLDFVFNPEQRALASTNYQDFVVEFLQQLIKDATAGNKHGPITGALEAFKDLRDQIRFVVEQGYLSNDEYLDFLIRKYTPLQNFIATGPPVLRLKQLVALIKVGIVELVPAGMQVRPVNDHFEAISKRKPQFQYEARYLVDARIPVNDNEVTANPLIKKLLERGLASLDARQLADGTSFLTRAINVEQQTDRLITADKEVVANLYLWGVPTEGKHWFTNVSFRPGVNDNSLITADRIAEAIFSPAMLVETPLAV